MSRTQLAREHAHTGLPRGLCPSKGPSVPSSNSQSPSSIREGAARYVLMHHLLYWYKSTRLLASSLLARDNAAFDPLEGRRLRSRRITAMPACCRRHGAVLWQQPGPQQAHLTVVTPRQPGASPSHHLQRHARHLTDQQAGSSMCRPSQGSRRT